MRNSVYYPGLDVVRLYAALSVVVMHLGQVPLWAVGRDLHFSPFLTLPFISGFDAVTLFFVLSGFLITLLLLREQQATGGISVQRFYWRRVLRIWPVYFAALGCSLLALSLYPDPLAAGPLWTDRLPLFFVMLPNLALSLNVPSLVNPFWSIGVEEQFYAVWPWLVKFASKPWRLWAVLAAVLIVRFLLIAILPFLLLTPVGWFLDSLRLDALALGAAGALLLHTNSPMLEVFYHRVTQSVSLIGLALIALSKDLPTRPPVYHFVIACVFLVLILNVASNERAILRLDRYKTLQTIGRATYGLYMYHSIVLYVVAKALAPASDVVFTVVFVTASLALSLGVSLLSYRLFESRFLRLTRSPQPEPLPASAITPTAL